MAIDKVTLRSAGRLLKFSSGPIIFPNPGPTTEIEVIAADILVMKSYPCIKNIKEIKKTPVKKKMIMTMTELIISSVIS